MPAVYAETGWYCNHISSARVIACGLLSQDVSIGAQQANAAKLCTRNFVSAAELKVSSQTLPLLGFVLQMQKGRLAGAALFLCR